MKKRINLLSIMLLLIVILTGCESKKELTDALKFKQEYENLNNSKNSDNTSKLPIVNIDEDNVIKYATIDDIKEILEGKTGVIYFGFPECPWCRNMVSVLLDAADITGIDTIYYYNNVDMRDKKSLDENGNIITEKEGTEEYEYIISKLYDYLGEYKGLNDDSIKRLYFPTVVFVYEGKIVDIHIGTLESQTDPYITLTNEQEEELKNIYIEGMHKVLNDICDETC